MNASFKFDMSGLKRAIRDLRPMVNKTKSELVEQAAKGFVKNVVAITPPASKGVSGSKAKQQGETAIKVDLARIMVAAARKRDIDARAAAASPEELYRRFRDKRTGRINPKSIKQPYRVAKSELNALLRKLLAEVGWLAAGWNEAARKLGVRLPAWVSRHGTGKGSVSKVQGFFVGVADKVAPVLKPLLDKMATMDFAQWGQQIGEVVAFLVQAFADGSIGDILLQTLKIAFATAGNIALGIFTSLGQVLWQLLAEAVKNAVFMFQVVTTADFWKGLGNALLASAQAFIAMMLDGVATNQQVDIHDPFSEAQTVSISTVFNDSYARSVKSKYRLHAVAKWEPPQEPTAMDRLMGSAVEPQTDEIKIATLWMVSPPNPEGDEDAIPDGTWVAYPQYSVFWNLAHAPRRMVPSKPPEPITLRTGLIGGLADSIFAALLAPVNDANSQIYAFLNASTFKGEFWTVSPGGGMVLPACDHQHARADKLGMERVAAWRDRHDRYGSNSRSGHSARRVSGPIDGDECGRNLHSRDHPHWNL